jgi:hypothetical protein
MRFIEIGPDKHKYIVHEGNLCLQCLFSKQNCICNVTTREESRARFEKWAGSEEEGFDLTKCDAGYLRDEAEIAWEAWQAAQRDMAEQIARLENERDDARDCAALWESNANEWKRIANDELTPKAARLEQALKWIAAGEGNEVEMRALATGALAGEEKER